MATRKTKGLGLGLEALLGPQAESAAPEGDRPAMLKLDQLRPGKYQPRTRMDEGALYELAESIKSQGVMQPVLVRAVGASGYEIIAGERRVRAARLAGLAEIPALVRSVPDEQAAVMALIENIQREDLNPLEEAQGLQRLVAEFKLTHDAAAQAVGRSRSAASNLLRLLNLAEPVQRALMAGDLDMGHARALLALPAAQQITSASEIAAKKLSVRETERLVQRALNGRQAPLLRAKPQPKSRDVARLEERLADHLSSTVEIRLKRRSRRGQSGELALPFDSFEALEALLQRMGLQEG